MSYFQKTFYAIFFVAVSLIFSVSAVGYYVARAQLSQQWQQDYQSLTATVGHTLRQMEAATDRVMRNAVGILSAWEQQHGLPSEQFLRELAQQTFVSHFFVTDVNGRFIRSTNGSPESLTTGLFEYAEEYKGLITGERDIAYTPIIPSKPYTGPFKYMMIPNVRRTRVLEASLHLDYIAKTLHKILSTDAQVLTAGLYTPTGVSLGVLSQAGAEAPEAQLNLASVHPVVVDFDRQVMTVTSRVEASVQECPECAFKGVSDGGPYYYLLKIDVSLMSLLESFNRLFYRIGLLCIVGVFISLIAAYLLARRLVAKLAMVMDGVQYIMNNSDLSYRIPVLGDDEVAELARYINLMSKALLQSQVKLLEGERDQALVQCAKQVAHDIRSPLTALRVVSSHLKEIAEEKRVMIRNAINRIDDIANDLAGRKAKLVEQKVVVGEQEDPLSIELLSSLLDSLISEKRTQFRSRLGVSIQSLLDEFSYGLFAKVQPVEFKRVLSNLINNAVEAMEEHGAVTINVMSKDTSVVVCVCDNGRGIPQDILPKLSVQGVTFGKAKGSGLGLYHARTTVESWGGSLALSSKVGHGTTITLQLPRVDAPSWFVPCLKVVPGTTIVVVDDDASIHQVWQSRFDVLGGKQPQVTVQHFTSGVDLERWYNGQSPVLFLCDYEFLGEKETGLDIIEQLGIQRRAVLVTSRFEEESVLRRCVKMGVKLIPKGLAGFVPIEIMDTCHPKQHADPSAVTLPKDGITRVPQNEGMKPKILVLDDDAGIRMAWELEQERLGVGHLQAYASMEACEAAAPDYAQYDFAFVDKNIPESIWRIDQVIQHLKNRGVKKVIVASGEALEAVKKDVLCQDADGIVPMKIPHILPDT